MASMSDVLASIPGYGAYIAKRQMNEQAGMQDLQQAGALSQILSSVQQQQQSQEARGRETAFRNEVAALGPNPTQEQMAQIASRYVNPAEALKTHQASLDRQATVQAAKENRAAALEQTLAIANQTHEARMARIGADERNAAARQAETERHNRAIEGINRQLAELKGQKLTEKPLPPNAINHLVEAGTLASGADRSMNTFKDEYAGKTVMGEASNTMGRLFGDSTGQAQWWQDYAAQNNVKRKALFGSALTATEKAEWEKAIVTPRMDPGEVRKNLKRQAELEAHAAHKLATPYLKGGFSREAIEGALGVPLDELQQRATPTTGVAPGAPQPQQTPLTPAEQAELDALRKKHGRR
jgi:hypothetical protein